MFIYVCRAIFQGIEMSGNKNLAYVAVAVIVVLIAIAVLVSTSKGVAQLVTAPGSFVPVSMTDPPHVPNGTSALVISYSSLQVQTSGGISSGWHNSNSSGTLNLPSLVNVTQTIAGVQLPQNAVVDQIRFAITSAKITINGTSYNVTVPSGQVSAHILGREDLNSSSGILLDFAPTVAVVYTANSTVFVLVPSVRAVVVPSNSSSAQIGHRSQLSARESGDLRSVAANVALSGVSLTSSANSTTLMLTVANHGNQSVVIRHVLVKGQEKAQVTLSEREVANQSEHANESVNASSHSSASENVPVMSNQSAHASAGSHDGESNALNATSHASAGVNASSNASASGRSSSNASAHLNVSASASASGVAHAAVNISVLNESRLNLEHFGVLNFLVAANGTLFLPATSEDVESESGFTLAAGAQRTLEFSGKISLGEGHLAVSLVPGSNYSVYVIGEQTLSASANVTAG